MAIPGSQQATGTWRDIAVRQDPTMVDGLGGVVWNGAYKLCAYLEEHPGLVRGKNVIELGAGCGLPGLFTATLGASSVVLTDQITDLLEENVKANVSICSAPVHCATLEWGNSAQAVQQLDALPILDKSNTSSSDVAAETDSCDAMHHIADNTEKRTFDVVLGSEVTSLGREAQAALLQMLEMLRTRSASNQRKLLVLLVSDMCSDQCVGTCASSCPTSRFFKSCQSTAGAWHMKQLQAFRYCDDAHIVQCSNGDPMNMCDGMSEDDWAAIWALEAEPARSNDNNGDLSRNDPAVDVKPEAVATLAADAAGQCAARVQEQKMCKQQQNSHQRLSASDVSSCASCARNSESAAGTRSAVAQPPPRLSAPESGANASSARKRLQRQLTKLVVLWRLQKAYSNVQGSRERRRCAEFRRKMLRGVDVHCDICHQNEEDSLAQAEDQVTAEGRTIASPSHIQRVMVSRSARHAESKKYDSINRLLFAGRGATHACQAGINLVEDDGTNWNARFQQALALSERTDTERLYKYTLLTEINRDFLATAETYAKTVISEYFVHAKDKSIRPVRVGGVAGGTKYLWRGILFKLANGSPVATNNTLGCTTGTVQPPYDGSNEAAAKAAGHDLRGCVELYKCRVPGLCFPLQALIDYRGFRMTAQAFVEELSAGSLVFGSNDGGCTIHNSDADLATKLAEAARQLGLAEHGVGLNKHVGDASSLPRVCCGCDVEGHKGTDGQYYVLDCARTFPPESPLAATHLASVRFRVGAHVLARGCDKNVAEEGDTPRPAESTSQPQFAKPKYSRQRSEGPSFPSKTHVQLKTEAVVLRPGARGIVLRARLSARRQSFELHHGRARTQSATELNGKPVFTPRGGNVKKAAKARWDSTQYDVLFRTVDCEFIGKSDEVVTGWPVMLVTGMSFAQLREAGRSIFWRMLRPEFVRERGCMLRDEMVELLREEQQVYSARSDSCESVSASNGCDATEQTVYPTGMSRCNSSRSVKPMGSGYNYDGYNGIDDSLLPAGGCSTTHNVYDASLSIGDGDVDGYSYAPSFSSDLGDKSVENPMPAVFDDDIAGYGYSYVPSSIQEPYGSVAELQPVAAMALELSKPTSHLEERIVQLDSMLAAPPALSADAFSAFSCADPNRTTHDKNAHVAALFLLHRVVPALARRLSAYCGGPDGKIIAIALSSELHFHGVNMRHLGLLRAHVSAMPLGTEPDRAELQQLILTEMVSRTLKNILRQYQRAFMKLSSVGGRMAGEQAHRNIVVCVLNLITGAHENSDAFWAAGGELVDGILQRYGCGTIILPSGRSGRVGLTDAEQQSLRCYFAPAARTVVHSDDRLSWWWCEAYGVPALVYNLCASAGIRINAHTRKQFQVSQRQQLDRHAFTPFEFVGADIEALEPHLKVMRHVEQTEGEMLLLQAKSRDALGLVETESIGSNLSAQIRRGDDLHSRDSAGRAQLRDEGHGQSWVRPSSPSRDTLREEAADRLRHIASFKLRDDIDLRVPSDRSDVSSGRSKRGSGRRERTFSWSEPDSDLELVNSRSNRGSGRREHTFSWTETGVAEDNVIEGDDARSTD